MAIDKLQLSLMAFPQSWTPGTGPTDDGTLAVNLLALPVGDPRQPLGGGAPFAGTAIHVIANISDSGGLPITSTTPLLSRPLVLTPPPVATNLFDQLYLQSAAKGMPPTTDAPKKVSPARIMKSLPPSYTNAVPVEQPGPNTQVGDGYGCALRGQAPPPYAPPQWTDKPIGPDTSIAWGQILSLALRQPVLAQALGLVYPVTIPVPPGVLAEGGFVYVALDTSNPANPWAAQLTADSDFARTYAAQLPALMSTGRAVFAATLVPVVGTSPGNLGTAQREAAIYDDGFAQVVHSNQPSTIDAATLAADRIAPASDAGIQLGWDDEQIAAWLNGQLDLLNVRINPADPLSANKPEAPLGVQGYRVDVRPAGGQHSWSSLCEVSGTAPFTDQGYGGNASTAIDGELWVAPAPVRPSAGTAGNPDNDGNKTDAWLPLYFALWTGGSVVLGDPVVQMLATAFSSGGSVTPPPTANPRADLSAVPPLLYGSDYEFRVRLVDLTGGGPEPDAEPVHPGPVPTTTVDFRRWVPPKALVVATDENLQPYPAVPPSQRKIHTLTVRRPRIGYPEALFAGVDPATFAPTNLATLIADAQGNGDVLDIADPDVGSFNVIVEAKMPTHDTGVAGTAPTEVDGVYRVIYAVAFDFGDGADPEVTLTLDYTDGVDDIGAMTAPDAGVTTLPIPTARDVRVRLQPQFDAKTNYYATGAQMTGPFSDYGVRQAAVSEDELFAGSAASQLSALYFQNSPGIAQLLAQQLNLAQNGLALSGPPGQRTVFGASGTLRHTITADDGTITFANLTELLGQWIVAITPGSETGLDLGRLRPAKRHQFQRCAVGKLHPRRPADRNDHRAPLNRGLDAAGSHRHRRPLVRAAGVLRRDQSAAGPGQLPGRAEPGLRGDGELRSGDSRVAVAAGYTADHDAPGADATGRRHRRRRIALHHSTGLLVDGLPHPNAVGRVRAADRRPGRQLLRPGAGLWAGPASGRRTRTPRPTRGHAGRHHRTAPADRPGAGARHIPRPGRR